MTIFQFFCSFEKGSRYVAQAGLELMILLSQSPEGWGRCVPPHPAKENRKL
jgi:hypothetical protein